MPYRLELNSDGTYKVVNALTGKVHAKHTSKAKGEAQIRVMEASENNPGWRGHRARRQSR